MTNHHGAPRAAAVVLAAGSGTRLGADTNKVLLPLEGLPVLVHSVRAVLDVPGIQRLVVVVRDDERDRIAEALAPHLGPDGAWLVSGGVHRHDSEWHGIQVLAHDIEAGEIDVVAIHDAARPLATPELWTAVIAEADANGGAIPVVDPGRLSYRDGRRAGPGLVGVQTPQAFRAAALLSAHEDAEADRWRGTDTAAVLERYADPAEVVVVGVPSTQGNLKVTYAEDLSAAGHLLAR